MYNIKTNFIYFIVGKSWNISVMETHIKIGCEFHSREEWKNFSDKEIEKMNEKALDFWKKEKEFILNLK